MRSDGYCEEQVNGSSALVPLLQHNSRFLNRRPLESWKEQRYISTALATVVRPGEKFSDGQLLILGAGHKGKERILARLQSRGND